MSTQMILSLEGNLGGLIMNTQQSNPVGLVWIMQDVTTKPLQYPRSYGYLQFPQRYPQNFIFHYNTHKFSFNVVIERKSMINPRQYPHLYINIAIILHIQIYISDY